MGEIGFDAKSAFGSVSLVGRCSDFMNRAFPGSGIAISNSKVATATDSVTVALEGVRKNVPVNANFARDVGAECRFENGVLTDFRWTAGPLYPARTGQAR